MASMHKFLNWIGDDSSHISLLLVRAIRNMGWWWVALFLLGILLYAIQHFVNYHVGVAFMESTMSEIQPWGGILYSTLDALLTPAIWIAITAFYLLGRMNFFRPPHEELQVSPISPKDFCIAVIIFTSLALVVSAILPAIYATSQSWEVGNQFHYTFLAGLFERFGLPPLGGDTPGIHISYAWIGLLLRTTHTIINSLLISGLATAWLLLGGVRIKSLLGFLSSYCFLHLLYHSLITTLVYWLMRNLQQNFQISHSDGLTFLIQLLFIPVHAALACTVIYFVLRFTARKFETNLHQ